MNRKQLLLCTTLTALITPSMSSAHAQEKKIARATLPAAVEKTVVAQSQGATIRGFATEREDGKKVYEAEMIFNGHTKDIQIAEDGTLNEIEEEVALEALPTGVRTALVAKAATTGAKIVKVESLTKKDKLVAYEAATLSGTKKGEIQVGPNGNKLTHEE